MEDLARLAVFEQSVGDTEEFSAILLKILEKFQLILENPHDYEFRTIRGDFLRKWLEVEAFAGYLKYLGFENSSREIIYPHKLSLNKLRDAEDAIIRKLRISCGSPNKQIVDCDEPMPEISSTKLKPVYALRTNNQFLLTVQSLFNEVLKYDDPGVQKLARSHIPVADLQIRAMERMRDHQRRIKTGKSTDSDLCFETAQLMELVAWFKGSFFSWMDRPPCELCGGDTQIVGTDVKEVKIELYKCLRCPGRAQFARHKDCRALLAARRGRCGEWADCFALLCVAMGYETRHVYDTTDHVWCEVYDLDSRRWLHVDPCEGAIDTPLLYEHGWGKKVEYVIACSRDDLQDVTWRYTSDFASVRARRNRCTETELVETIVTLREARQSQCSSARRKILAKNALVELVQLMVPRKPSDYESRGRISGSKEWRTQRGEIGTKSHTFESAEPGTYVISYFTSIDKYKMTRDNVELGSINGWEDGAFSIDNVFRKEELDWKMVYLAREEGSDQGVISWRFASAQGLRFSSLMVAASSALYEDGAVEWTVQFDDEEPIAMESEATYSRAFTAARIAATMSGGRGREAWQHAQLFRQSKSDQEYALRVVLKAERK